VTIANQFPNVFPLLHEVALPEVALAGLGARILNLGRGQRLTLVGIGFERVAETLKAESLGDRSALLIDTAGSSTTDASRGTRHCRSRVDGRDLLDAAMATQPIDPVVTAPDRRKPFKVIEGGPT
jgi:hypothetical protein